MAYLAMMTKRCCEEASKCRMRLLLTHVGGICVLASLFPVKPSVSSRIQRTGVRISSLRRFTTPSTSTSMSRLASWLVDYAASTLSTY